MRELADRSTQLVATEHPDQQRSAVLAVTRQVQTGRLTPGEAREELGALGLLDVAADMLARMRRTTVAAIDRDPAGFAKQ